MTEKKQDDLGLMYPAAAMRAAHNGGRAEGLKEARAEQEAIGLTYKQALDELEASEAERAKLLARVDELEAAWNNLHAMCNPGAPPGLIASLAAVNLIAPGAVLVGGSGGTWVMSWNRALTSEEHNRVQGYLARLGKDAFNVSRQDGELSRALTSEEHNSVQGYLARLGKDGRGTL